MLSVILVASSSCLDTGGPDHVPALDMINASDLPGQLTGWSTLALALLAIGALVGTGISIHVTRRESRRARTYEYMRRLFAPEFLPMVARTRHFLKSGEWKAASRLDQPQTVHQKRANYDGLGIVPRAKIVLVLNFFEELSGSYRSGLLDEEIAESMLAPVIRQLWEEARWLVEYQREKIEKLTDKATANQVMDEWEALVMEQAERGRRT